MQSLFYEEALYDKENEVLLKYYECAEQDIADSMFFEASGDGEGILAKAKRKIQEIIEKIKEFFRELKAKHDQKKIQSILDTEVAKSNMLVTSTINSTAIENAINNLYKVEQESLTAMAKAHDDYKKGKISLDALEKKQNDIIQKIEKAMDDYNKTERKTIQTRQKHQAVEIKKVREEANKVVRYYNDVIAKCNADILKYEAEIHKDLDDAKIATGAVKTSVNMSKVNKKLVIGIGVAAGIGSIIGFFKVNEKKYLKALNSDTVKAAEDAADKAYLKLDRKEDQTIDRLKKLEDISMKQTKSLLNEKSQLTPSEFENKLRNNAIKVEKSRRKIDESYDKAKEKAYSSEKKIEDAKRAAIKNEKVSPLYLKLHKYEI